MTDKNKGNLLFGLAIVLLILALVFQGNIQMLFGITGGILIIISLTFSAKSRIKAIISFFRGY